jgi:type IV pilus assembly protein PilC
MEFRCRLGTPNGEVTEQVMVADNEARLRRELEDRGLYVLSIQGRGVLKLGGWSMPTRRRVPTREFLVSNQELATLLKAGMPLVQSLDILRQRVSNPVFKGVLDDVYERVRSGAALSEAFEEHRDLFPGIYTASLVAGEKSGGLEPVLRRYVSYVKVVGAVKRRMVSALVYPIILLLLSLAVVGIIVVQVVPAFAGFYETFDQELPLATRIIIGLSEIVGLAWPVILLGAIGSGAAVWAWGRRPANLARVHRAMLRVPFLGSIARKFATSQLARTLATLLGGGVPLVNALSGAARASSNRYMASEMEAVGDRVREGEAMAAAMLARGVFPDVAIKMVEVGESTGALQEMLNSLADFYDEEIETSLSRFVTLIEPVLLVVMGLIIAVLLLALYLPVFQLSSVTH